jgi:hypothetical protein
MDTASALTTFTDQPALDAVAEPMSRAIRGAYQATGAAGQRAKNAAHGVVVSSTSCGIVLSLLPDQINLAVSRQSSRWAIPASAGLLPDMTDNISLCIESGLAPYAMTSGGGMKMWNIAPAVLLASVCSAAFPSAARGKRSRRIRQ